MRRAALVAVFMLLFLFHLAGDETAGIDPTPDNAILFELSGLAISLGGDSWLVGMAAEYQRALGSYVVLSVITELTAGTIRQEFGALLGLAVHPFGSGLRGMFIGIHPGFSFASGSTYFIAEADVGYQWVLDHGIVLLLSIGGRHDGRIGITRSGSFRIGFAF